MSKKVPVPTRVKKTSKYRVRNWSEYNKSLINRGNPTFWIEEGIDKVWLNKKSSKRGRPNVYSDQAIEFF